MLRQIGRGAYGDVWLARGLTGVYRAIKVVWRDRFEDRAPYEREFRGVKEAMAFSLEPGQLPLLHIGQDEAAGYFYYVMELADDVSPAARSIGALRAAHAEGTEGAARRLPAAQCLEFAEILAQALAALHARGLVHRDIKPSNVVIVHSRPTLADIGLLATAGEAKTYVGTQGYLAPEGPGSAVPTSSPSAGCSTNWQPGLIASSFPRLPADVTDRAERAALFELNEILLRAGEPLAQNRYPDATAMLADLRARRSRGIGRRRWWRGLGLTAVFAAALLAWWQLRPAAIPPPSLSPPPPALAKVVPANSIALLPFENLSDDKANGYFASGLQEDLLTNLAGIRALKIISRESAARFRGTTKSLKQVGAELGARYILSGSIRRDTRIVRVTAQLIDAQTDEQIWAKRFERELSQVLTLESALADEIITALQPSLLPGEKTAATKEVTSSAAAYDLYLKAKHSEDRGFGDPGGIDAAEDWLRQALALDPNFVRAWVSLATVHRWHYFNDGTDPTPERIAKAEQAIDEARRLAPDAPEVLVGLGLIRDYCHRDPDGAAAFFREVLATHPDYTDAHRALAFMYRRMGRWAEALTENRTTWQLDPGSPYAAVRYVDLLITGRRYAEALEWLKILQRSWLDDRSVRFNLAELSFYASESEAELERWWAGIPAAEREQPDVIDMRLEWAFNTGNERVALDLIRRYGITWQNMGAASLLFDRGEKDQVRAYLDKMKPEFDDWLAKSGSAGAWPKIAQYYALHGDRAEALAAIARARQFNVESYDVWNGRGQAVDLIFPLVFLGEKDAAMAEIERLVKLPRGVWMWELKHSLVWNSLRAEPRIQAILADPKNREPLF
ncbi:MAG: tetratricopeptide repeat protein [Lacunisphaera sp.]